MNPEPASTPAASTTASVDAALATAHAGMTAMAATKAPPKVDIGQTPAQAAEADRIEQEWVTKTKHVLLATRNDPYEQAQQLAALKADYMRKRYNKEIKLGE